MRFDLIGQSQVLNPQGNIPTTNLPPFSNIHPRYGHIGGSRPRHRPGKILVNCHYAYHYIVLRDDGTEPSDISTTDQSKARRLGEGPDFSPPMSLPHMLHVSPARVTW